MPVEPRPVNPSRRAVSRSRKPDEISARDDVERGSIERVADRLALAAEVAREERLDGGVERDAVRGAHEAVALVAEHEICGGHAVREGRLDHAIGFAAR